MSSDHTCGRGMNTQKRAKNLGMHGDLLVPCFLGRETEAASGEIIAWSSGWRTEHQSWAESRRLECSCGYLQLVPFASVCNPQNAAKTNQPSGFKCMLRRLRVLPFSKHRGTAEFTLRTFNFGGDLRVT